MNEQTFFEFTNPHIIQKQVNNISKSFGKTKIIDKYMKVRINNTFEYAESCYNRVKVEDERDEDKEILN